MSSTGAGAVLLAGGSAAGLWVLYFWLYWDYRVDRTRQALFTIRDDLFDLAAAGALPFAHPAYVLLRKTINGIVRFTHRIDLPLVIALVASGHGPEADSLAERLDAAAADLPEPVRAELQAIARRLDLTLAQHLVMGSLPLLLGVGLFHAAALLRDGWSAVVALFRRPIDAIDAVATEHGSL